MRISQFVALAVLLGTVAGLFLLRPIATDAPPRGIFYPSETDDWLSVLVAGGEVEFKNARRSIKNGAEEVEVIVASSLGPITDESVRNTIAFFEQQMALLLEDRLSQIEKALAESEGEEYSSAYDDFLATLGRIELKRAAINQVGAGEYISYKYTFPQDVFPKADYTWSIVTSGILESGEHVALFIPIPFDKYPSIRQLDEDRAKLATESLATFARSFNEKQFEERSKLYQGYMEAMAELTAVYATVDDSSERYERWAEIAPRLMPRQVFIDEATLLMYKRH